MSNRRKFEVIAAGHEHAGKVCAIGDIVELSPSTAARYESVFKPVAENDATATKQAADAVEE